MRKTFKHEGEWFEEVEDGPTPVQSVCHECAFGPGNCMARKPARALGCAERGTHYIRIQKPAAPAAQPASATRPPTRESQIETYLRQQVKIRDGEIRKVTWIGQSKAPDRLVMLPNRADPSPGAPGHTLWVEVKAPGKGNTFPADAHERAQAREHARMRAVGQKVFVIDSYEGVDRLLNQYR